MGIGAKWAGTEMVVIKRLGRQNACEADGKRDPPNNVDRSIGRATLTLPRRVGGGVGQGDLSEAKCIHC